MLHLADEWRPDDGGELRFRKGYPQPAHATPQAGGHEADGFRDFEPRFNRLLLFLTRPAVVPHEVLRVKRKRGGLGSAEAPPGVLQRTRPGRLLC